MASSGTRDNGIDARQSDEDCREANQEHVASRPADERSDHGCACWLIEALQRGAQIAFGIDEEVGGGDHLLARLEAVSDLDIAIATTPELDGARLEAALALGNQHDLTRAAVDHRAVGNGGDRFALGSRVEHHVGIHARLHQSVRIGQLNANRDGARFGLHHLGIDEGHRSFVRLFGESPQRDRGVHAEFDVGNIGLGDFGDDPDTGVVGDTEQLVASRDALTLDDVFFNHVAGCRGRPIDRPRVGHGLAHLVDADLWDTEIAKLLHGAFEVAAEPCGVSAVRSHGHHEVGLSQLNLRAIKAEQRLALRDMLSGLVDEELLDIAVGAHRHDGEQRLRRAAPSRPRARC